MTVFIRPVHMGDGGAACHVFLRAVRTLGASSYSPEQLAAWVSRMTPERLEARLLATVSFVAEHEGRVVGFVSLDALHAELDFLYVHPSLAGEGIGRRLSERIEQEARRRDLPWLWVVASLNAVPIYERLGYRHESDMAKTIDGISVPCVRMSKAL